MLFSRQSGALSKSFRSNPLLVRSSGPHRLSSNSQPRRPSSAPQNTRNQFKVVPILILIAISSGSYALLVKSRTGQSQRPSN
jgi:hypothetical protein